MDQVAECSSVLLAGSSSLKGLALVVAVVLVVLGTLLLLHRAVIKSEEHAAAAAETRLEDLIIAAKRARFGNDESTPSNAEPRNCVVTYARDNTGDVEVALLLEWPAGDVTSLRERWSWDDIPATVRRELLTHGETVKLRRAHTS